MNEQFINGFSKIGANTNFIYRLTKRFLRAQLREGMPQPEKEKKDGTPKSIRREPKDSGRKADITQP